MLRPRRPLLGHLRGIAQVVATFGVIIAFTTIPLAEVYAVVFLTPAAAAVVAVLVLREPVSPVRWVLMATGFAGVLLVVRPGFREIQPGHLTALIAVAIGAFNIVALRILSAHEKRVTLVGIPIAYIITVSAVLMLPGFVMPSGHQWLLLVATGLFGGCGQLLFIAAARRAGASEIAPAQYSQMLWALILGATFFGEFPDAIGFAGLAVLVVSGLGIVLVDRLRRPPAG
jgi:drug/metabolite transporter (DMT)-like permease